jgi:hypothetical protein
VVNVTQGRLPDYEAKEYTSWRDNGGRAALLYFLLNLDLSDFNGKAPAPMSSAKQEMIDDNRSDFEGWLDHLLDNIDAIMGRDICSAEELVTQYRFSSGHKASTKTVSIALSKRGIKRLSKQAKLNKGKRIRVYALVDHQKYEAKTDKALGEIIEAKLNGYT